MKRKPEIIDAEFEIVGEGKLPTVRVRKRHFRRIGDLTDGVPDPDPFRTRVGFSYFSAPIEWLRWRWYQRLFYVAFSVAALVGIWFLHHWLMVHLPLPDHW